MSTAITIVAIIVVGTLPALIISGVIFNCVSDVADIIRDAWRTHQDIRHGLYTPRGR